VQVPLAGMIFSLNMLIVGTLLFMQWSYASKTKNMISETVTPEQIAKMRRRTLIMPAIAIIAIVLAFMGFPWTVMLYALSPIAYFFV
jgi:uncharacterized membrane protein